MAGAEVVLDLPGRLRRSSGRLTLCGLSAASLGLGEVWTLGRLSNLAVLLLLLAASLAALAARRGRWRQDRRWWAVLALLCGLGNLPYIHHFPQDPVLQVLCTLLLTAAAAGAAWLPRGRRAALLIGVAALALLALMAVTWTWGSSSADVFGALSGASRALLQGHDPYTPLFRYYVEANPDHVLAPFDYGPILPLLAIPGEVLGDVRVMSVVCVAVIVAGVWCMARRSAPRDTHRVAALALAVPLWAGMVDQSWVDTYMMAGIIGWLALRRRHRRWAILLLTVALLVKPTALIVLVPAFLWSRRARLEIGVAVVLGIVYAIPFVLATGAGSFARDVIGYALSLPPRTDSLSLAALLYDRAHVLLSGWVPVLLLLAGAALVAWRGRPATDADLAVQAALLNVVAFVAAKQAFFNYYFVSEVMLLAAMASAAPALPEGDVALPLSGLRHRLAARSRPSASPAAAG
jgi:hypothetical protein